MNTSWFTNLLRSEPIQTPAASPAAVLEEPPSPQPELPEAVNYLHRAMTEGDPDAQFTVGAQRLRDSSQLVGAERDEIRTEALMWFLLASAGGCGKANPWRERLQLDLERDQVTEAKRRADMFKSAKELLAHAHGA